MLHHLIVHVADVAGDEGVKSIVDASLRPVTDMITRQVARHFGITPGSNEEIASLRTEMDRVKETVASFEAVMGAIQRDPNTDWARIRREAEEPATAKFVRKAIDVSANTTRESKRLLAGALIAKRLQTATDSDEEILLRRALYAIEDLTENQLQILAAASMVQDPRTSWQPTSENPSRDEAERALLPLFSTARRFLDILDFGEDQFGTLASVGAIRLHNDTGAIIAYESADPFDAWIQLKGVSPYDGIEGDWGSNESHKRYRQRFPTISTIRALAAKPNGSEIHQGRRVDGVILTPLGWTIAELVLDQLLSPAPTSSG